MSPLALIAGSLLLLGLAYLARPAPPGAAEIRGAIRFLWWLNLVYTSFWHRLVVENAPPLPRNGPAILISNHTCGIDHLILQASTRRLIGFMIAKEFYENRIYHPFCKAIGCIPAKRDGRDQTALRLSLRALRDGRVLGIFPEGRINPTSGREFLDVKPGAMFIALREGVPVIPAYICGTPATREIGAALMTRSHARVAFGPPVDLSDLFESRGHAEERARLDEATDRIMGAIRALRDHRAEATNGQSP
jgi:1-acyl-sn-glycerol-3-phosphate acyltransferase